jgi:pimeloyl-ACP methyl ester carboxylesterase
VVLVHGAFAGPSSWDGVVPLLEADGFTVNVVENPLRGPAADAAAVRAALDQIEGPVVLVGHSYGGIAITNAATGNPNVKALVYIAAYVPDDGDTLAALQAYEPPGAITPDVLVLEPYTKPDGTAGLNAHIKPEAFQAVFSADLPADQAATLAAQQMPIDAGALTEASGVPAWRTIPSWYLAATHDRVIPPDAARRMAERANATTVEVDASHAVLVSQPAAVVDLIRQAVATFD